MSRALSTKASRYQLIDRIALVLAGAVVLFLLYLGYQGYGVMREYGFNEPVPAGPGLLLGLFTVECVALFVAVCFGVYHLVTHWIAAGSDE